MELVKKYYWKNIDDKGFLEDPQHDYYDFNSGWGFDSEEAAVKHLSRTLEEYKEHELKEYDKTEFILITVYEEEK